MTSAPLGNPWLQELPPYSLLRNDERKARLRSAGRTVHDFGIGDPQEDTPAFIREALVAALPRVSQYPLALGGLPLREACAGWARRRFGVTLDATRQVISSNGSKEAIFHIPHVLLNNASRKRMLVYPDPGFPVYRSSAILSGAVGYETVLRPEKGYVFDPDDVPVEILPHVAAVWISYPHNPTGAQLPRQQAQRIYDWARAHDVVVLSDECYVDMYFGEGTPPPVSLLEIAATENYRNVLCFFTLSKRSGMTGYRSGFVAGDERLISLFGRYRPHAGLGTPEFVQAAARAAWNDDAHVRERNIVFRDKRTLVDAFLARNGFETLPSQATFYVWVKAPQPFTSGEAYAEALAHATGIVVTPGDALGQSCAAWFRLALVPGQESLTQCLALWQQAIDSKGLAHG